ncbi:MAG TPA: hypothetical protein VF120_17265, partial [Ktedonobacterales bacterium]
MVTASPRPTSQTFPTFTNEPLADFSKAANVAAQEAALRQVASEFDHVFPLVIAGERVSKPET